MKVTKVTRVVLAQQQIPDNTIGDWCYAETDAEAT